MKISHRIALATAAFVASFGAFAEGARYDYPSTTVSTLSRAEVRTQLDAALAMGATSRGERSVVVPATGRALSRMEVAAELAAARGNGEISRGESVFVAESHSRRHRADMAAMPAARATQ